MEASLRVVARMAPFYCGIEAQARKKCSLRGTESISNLTFSPDGQTLASGSGGTIRFWDTITGEERDAFTGLPANIGDLSFSPDGKTIVSVTWDGEICILDVIAGKLQRTFTVRMMDVVFSVAFSPDGKIVAIGNSDGNIYLSDLNTGVNSSLRSLDIR